LAACSEPWRNSGLFGNTLFVFSSDNGLALGSHGLMGKQSLYEHSMKVPLILTGPGIRKGSSDALVYLMDLFPTLVDLVGAPIPPGLDGVSLKPILTGRSPKVRDTLFTAYRDVQRAIRDERWKLIVYPRINRKQLFDLKNDPEETRDLAGDPRYASIIERLMNQLRQWQQRFSDSVPLSSERPADPTFKPPSPEEYQQLRRKWKM
jgi:arylsulfatase A-like enzyme